MPLIKYEAKKFRPKTLEVIRKANEIIAEYAAQGFDLTLRQLYYQFVSRDLIPNTQREYSNLGSAINDGRLAGLIDWNAIVDRTRYIREQSHWTSPEQIIDAVAKQFRLDKWEGQEFRPEVWIEKDALVGVFQGVCDDLDIPLFSCRGYTSQSEMWAASQRLLRHRRNGYTPFILHFGDHDPSGKDMSRDIGDRLRLFTGAAVKFERLALNMDQVEQYGPPPNPAKITDSRATAYIAEYGGESWELDALEPSVLAQLVRDAIDPLIDKDILARTTDEENDHKVTLSLISDKYEDVKDYVEGN